MYWLVYKRWGDKMIFHRRTTNSKIRYKNPKFSWLALYFNDLQCDSLIAKAHFKEVNISLDTLP